MNKYANSTLSYQTESLKQKRRLSTTTRNRHPSKYRQSQHPNWTKQRKQKDTGRPAEERGLYPNICKFSTQITHQAWTKKDTGPSAEAISSHRKICKFRAQINKQSFQQKDAGRPAQERAFLHRRTKANNTALPTGRRWRPRSTSKQLQHPNWSKSYWPWIQSQPLGVILSIFLLNMLCTNTFSHVCLSQLWPWIQSHPLGVILSIFLLNMLFTNYLQSHMVFALMTMNSVTSSWNYFIYSWFEYAFHQLHSITYVFRTYDHEFSHILLDLFYHYSFWICFLPIHSVTYVFRSYDHEFSHILSELFYRYSFWTCFLPTTFNHICFSHWCLWIQSHPLGVIL